MSVFFNVKKNQKKRLICEFIIIWSLLAGIKFINGCKEL
jgi:hypothetical protein